AHGQQVHVEGLGEAAQRLVLAARLYQRLARRQPGAQPFGFLRLEAQVDAVDASLAAAQVLRQRDVRRRQALRGFGRLAREDAADQPLAFPAGRRQAQALARLEAQPPRRGLAEQHRIGTAEGVEELSAGLVQLTRQTRPFARELELGE